VELNALSAHRVNVPANEVVHFFNNRLEALSRWHSELGDVFFVTDQMCFLFQPEHVRLAFASDNSQRVYDSLGRRWSEASESGWKQFRSEMTKQLLNTEQMTEIASQETQQVKEGTYDIVELMLDLTSRSMCALVLGTSRAEIVGAVQQNIKAVLKKHATWFDLPLLIPTPINIGVRRTVSKAKQAITSVLKQRPYRGLPIRSNYGDFKDVEVARSLLAAGSLPPAIALAWLWYLLEQHPQFNQRLQQEVDQGNTVSLDAALKETLRLYPPISFLLTTSKAALCFGDTLIPAKTLVAYSPYCIHRDERFWAESAAFKPERWFEQTRHPAYLPFGVGLHSCMATALANTMMSAVASSMIRRFCLRATQQSNLTHRRSSILMPQLLEMEVVRR
jgi:cytochrome P450